MFMALAMVSAHSIGTVSQTLCVFWVDTLCMALLSPIARAHGQQPQERRVENGNNPAQYPSNDSLAKVYFLFLQLHALLA